MSLLIGTYAEDWFMAEFEADNEQRKFEDTVQEWQDSIESNVRKIGKGSWARILRMARKP